MRSVNEMTAAEMEAAGLARSSEMVSVNRADLHSLLDAVQGELTEPLDGFVHNYEKVTELCQRLTARLAQQTKQEPDEREEE